MNLLYALHLSGKGRYRNIHNKLPYPQGTESPDGEATCLTQSGNASVPSWGVTVTSGGCRMVPAGGTQLGEGSLAGSCRTGRMRFDRMVRGEGLRGRPRRQQSGECGKACEPECECVLCVCECVCEPGGDQALAKS